MKKYISVIICLRLLLVSCTPIREVLERSSQLVPYGENDGRTRFTATMLFALPEVLHGLGIIADRGGAPYVLEVATGERVTMTLSSAPIGNLSDWRMATADKPPLYLQRLNESWWAELLPDGKTVYFSFTAYPQDTAFRERTTALARLLDESKARRLVIDLRRNQGGDFQQFRQMLLPIIKERPAINRKGGLFVITGPGTFHAASTNALDLRIEANAILVGCPTGQKPNHYGDHGELRLPNSGLRVSYSTRYHRFGADNDSAVNAVALISIFSAQAAVF